LIWATLGGRGALKETPIPVREPYKGLIRPFKGLIRPLKGLIDGNRGFL